jgi:hypothetical protein
VIIQGFFIFFDYIDYKCIRNIYSAPQLPPGAYPHDGGSEDGIGTIRKYPDPTVSEK